MNNMKNTELTHEQITYYKAYKDLFILHQKYYGKNYVPNVPTLFSEDVCRTLLGLNKIPGRECDAELGGKTYEIKATCYPNTKTTFARDLKSDEIVWICVNPNEDIVYIKRLLKEDVILKIESDKSGNPRANVNLEQIGFNEKFKYNLKC